MKAYFCLNDYELIYLILENNQIAERLIYDKYQPFIKAKIRKFNIDYYFYDEYLQEGNLTLFKAIRTFNFNMDNKFLTYFDCLLHHHFINCVKSRKMQIEKFEYKETDYVCNPNFLEEQAFEYEITRIEKELISNLEKNIFKDYFIQGLKINYIETKYHYNTKQIYNAIRRIKEKLRR